MNSSAFLKKTTSEVYQENATPIGYPEKRLLAEIVRRYFDDLKAYVKAPEMTERYLIRTGQSVDWVLEFWKEHALHFLTVILSPGKAKFVLRKLEPLIRDAEEIYRERIKSGSFAVARKDR